MASLTLDKLSTELLLLIFSHLEVKDLCRVRRTCKRLHEVVTSWSDKLVGDVTPLVTNMRDPRMLKRSPNIIPILERLRIEDNWKRGKFKLRNFVTYKCKYMPWIQLDKNHLWISKGKYITCYKRQGFRYNFIESLSISDKSNADVVRFRVKDNHMLMGKRDGEMSLWSLRDRKKLYESHEVHDSDVNCVDMANNSQILFSGSRDRMIKMWRQDELNGDYVLVYQRDLDDNVWCGVFSDDETYVAVGTAAVSNDSCIKVFDSERFYLATSLFPHRTGDGILDIKWDTPHTILSCSYDAHIRRWDLRTGKCVSFYEDPYDCGLYCFETDYFNTIVGGTRCDGRVTLWDMRKPKCVQVYFAKTRSPIYSLTFNAKYIYLATDQLLVSMDFSLYDRPSVDYTFAL